MSSYLPFIVIGLATGSVYGLVASGLVLTYRTSGLFNFGQGAIAAAGAFVFYSLNVQAGLSWGVSMLVVVVGMGVVLGWLAEPLARRLAVVSTTYKVIGTVGLILIVQGLVTIRFGTGVITQPAFLPQGTAVRVFGAVVSWDQIIIMLTGIATVVGLQLFLRRTRTGMATRGVVDDAELLALSRLNPVRVQRFSWILGSMMALLAGVLIAPESSLDAVVLTFLIVQAFGAAAIGGFSNLPLVYAGALVLGIATALSTKWSGTAWLAGLPSGLPFLVLIVVMVIAPRRLLSIGSAARVRSRSVWHAPTRVRVFTAVAVLALLALVPPIVGFELDGYTNALIQAIILLSLGLLVRTSGQVSLCQLAFAAVGAMAFYHFRVDWHIPWLPSLLLAGVTTVPVGAVVAFSAVRLSGLYLALATLGFGIAMQYVVYPLGIMFATGTTIRLMPRPSWGASDRGFYYVVLAVFVVAAIVVVAINEGRLGRLSRGMSDSPVAMSTLGLDLRVTRLLIFCISALIAGIAGALFGVLYNVAGADSYPAYQSLVLVAVLALAPFAEPWYALVAAAGVAVIPIYLQSPNASNWLNVAFGVFAIAVSVRNGPETAPLVVRRLVDRLGPKKASAPAVSADGPSRSVSLQELRASTRMGSGLAIADLSVTFGGLVAVRNLSLTAPVGRVTGLIGPNGAGKTTTFNACTGLVRVSSGRVMLDGKDVTDMDPSARGRRGLGRTFQRMELFDSLTVRQNVALGREAPMGGARPWAQLGARAKEREQIATATDAAMALCGIDPIAEQQAGTLSTGERRLVELARCIAGPFDVLLLDEPSSGLDRQERAKFGEILRDLSTETGVGILLVEHDVSLVLDVCQYVYVLDFGELIFEGTAGDVESSSQVRAAYLGDEFHVDREHPAHATAADANA